MWLLAIILMLIAFPVAIVMRMKEIYDDKEKKANEKAKKIKQICNHKGCRRNAYTDHLLACEECYLKYCKDHILTYKNEFYNKTFHYCKDHAQFLEVVEKKYREKEKEYYRGLEAEREKKRMAEFEYIAKKERDPSVNKCCERYCYNTDVEKCTSDHCNTYMCAEHNIYNYGYCYSCWDAIDGD